MINLWIEERDKYEIVDGGRFVDTVEMIPWYETNLGIWLEDGEEGFREVATGVVEHLMEIDASEFTYIGRI